LFTGSPTHSKGLGNTYGAGEADETVQVGDQAPAEEEADETESTGSEAEKLQAEEERQKRAHRVEEQRQRREADGTKITDQEQKEADDAEDDYYRSEDWARLKVMRSARHQEICKLVEQASTSRARKTTRRQSK
jgi:hypothetical protein